MPKPEDHRPEGVGIYIRQIPVHMSQVINTTLDTIKPKPEGNCSFVIIIRIVIDID